MLKALIFLVTWLPTVFFWAVFILALIAYFVRHKFSLRKWSKILIAATAFYYLAYAALATVGQYYTWKGSVTFTANLLKSPLASLVQTTTFWGKLPFIANSRLGYFIFYSWGRFWLSALLSIACGVIFWLILKGLKKYRERFFEDGEVELGMLTAMLTGWPQFIVFVPFVFALVVVISIIRLVFFKEIYTTLGIPMLFAALLTHIFSNSFALLLTGLVP
jgi:hypothetical protein